MIITLTMNPALDRTLNIPDFTAGSVNRAVATRTDIGGKGINVSKALKEMGTDSMACGFIAGRNGRMIKEYLSSASIAYDFVEVPGETRVNIKIIQANGTHTDINEPGFDITDSDFKRLIERVSGYARRGNILVISGSTPPNLKVEEYGRMCSGVTKRGSRLVVDTSGNNLIESLKAQPDFIKPNVMEMSQALGREFNTRDEICDGARELISMGAKNVAVSMGPNGAVFMNEKYGLAVSTPKVPVRGPVGAGDVMVAGIIHAMQNDMDFETLSRYAVAAASASVTIEGTKMASRRTVLQLFSVTKTEQV